MRVLILFLAISSSAMAQRPGGLLSRPLVYPGSAFDQSRQRHASQYPYQYSYPKRKAWEQRDRMIDAWEADAMRRLMPNLEGGPGMYIYTDETPQPWMYPWLFR
jgi:hypothetical protein